MSTEIVTTRPRSVDEVVKAMMSPGTTLPAGVEEALFGSSMHDLGGMEPSRIRIEEVQYRLINTLLDNLAARVERGQRDDLHVPVAFALTVVGEQLTGILAQVGQHKEAEIRQLRSQEGVIAKFLRERGVWTGPKLREALDEETKITAVTREIKARVGRLVESINASFLLESDVPENVKKAAEILATLQPILNDLQQLLEVVSQPMVSQLPSGNGDTVLDYNREKYTRVSSIMAIIKGVKSKLRIIKEDDQSSFKSGARFKHVETAITELPDFNNESLEFTLVDDKVLSFQVKSTLGALEVCMDEFRAVIASYTAPKMRAYLAPRQ